MKTVTSSLLALVAVLLFAVVSEASVLSWHDKRSSVCVDADVKAYEAVSTAPNEFCTWWLSA